MQKRSRPDWLDHDSLLKARGADYDSKVKERDPSRPEPRRDLPLPVILIRESLGVVKRTPAQTPGVNNQPSTASRLVPQGTDMESRVVREYLQHHACEEKDVVVARTLCENVSAVLRVPCSLVGSLADGTASRTDSFSSFTVVPLCETLFDRGDVFENLRAAGPARGWTAKYSPTRTDTVLIHPLAPRGLTVSVRLRQSDFLVRRTELVLVYCTLLEPRITVALCFIRSCLLRDLSHFSDSLLELDFFIFTLLFGSLMELRVVPNLLGDDDRRDARIWADLSNTSAMRVRETWRTQGIHVSARLSVVEIIQAFLAYARRVLDPETAKPVLCPISGESIISQPGDSHKIWQALCLLQPTRV